MGTTERKQRDKELFKEKILDAASALLLKEGYENLSIRKIAKTIEYAPATIYNYFKNKAELVSFLVDDLFLRFMEKMKQFPSSPGGDPVYLLKESAKIFIANCLENPNQYRAIFSNNMGELNQKLHFLTEGISRQNEGWGMLTGMIEECVKAGQFRELDTELAAQVFWSAIHGLTTLLIAQPDLAESQKEKLIENLLDTMIKGFEK